MLQILCLLCLCSVATAQDKDKEKAPLLYKGKNLRYWLDCAFVEKPEVDRSFASIALKTLDPKGKTVKRLCLKMISRGNEYEKVVGANVLFRVYGECQFSVKPLIEIAKTGKKHKGMAMIVLARFGEKAKAVVPLVGKTAAGKSDDKSDALFALEKFGTLAKSEAGQVKAVAEDKDCHGEDRIQAGRAYWRMTSDAAPLLSVLKAYLSDKDFSQSVNKALEVLGEDALPLWKMAIESIPEGPKGTFRFYALEKLGVKSLPFLKNLIDDGKPERLQREAVLALGRMAISRTRPIDGAIPLLVKALNLKAEKPVYFATVFFVRLGTKGKAALGRLDELGASPNAQIGKSAKKAAAAIRKALKK